MRLLLDTHVFLWSKENDRRMLANAWSMLRDPSNELLISAVSAAELAIKLAAGKLTLDMPLSELWTTGTRNGQLLELPLRAVHALRMQSLPLHHRDPFDRMLVATALEEELTLLTNDHVFRQYPVQIAW